MAPSSVQGHSFEPAKDKNGRNIQHYRIPRYAPFGDFQDVFLHKNAYRPRDLLNHAAVTFHNRSDAELSERQLDARDKFVSRFQARKSAYGKNVRTAASLARFRDDVRYNFNRLDEFFFFGLLGDGVRVKSGLDVVGEDPLAIEDAIDGETYACSARGHAYMQIRVNVGSGRVLYELAEVVGLLMHEMVHAYLMIFGCDCVRCERDALNTVGREDDGHGPVFLMLHRLVLTEIRRWGVDGGDADLQALLAEDCPGPAMSRSARLRAKIAIDDMTKGDRMWYNPIRSQQNPNYLISFGGSGGAEVVVAEARLMDRQIEMEDALRARWAEKERDDDNTFPRGMKGKLDAADDEEEDDDVAVKQETSESETDSSSASESENSEHVQHSEHSSKSEDSDVTDTSFMRAIRRG
ncbi:hypothetical protein F4781DRAFT_441199 [Annulohypoxylon bovei var. microspora]|nr:hypothetical protein F4781DRAFT_441199 [Annulohypoxylon bovei var. microspora]